MFCLLSFRQGVHFCYKEPRSGQTSSNLNFTDVGAIGVSYVDVDAGYVNKASAMNEDDARYTNVESKSDGYMMEASALDPPEYHAPAPPPEYTRHPSCVEIGGNMM